MIAAPRELPPPAMDNGDVVPVCPRAGRTAFTRHKRGVQGLRNARVARCLSYGEEVS
jgi:hypothetical protein